MLIVENLPIGKFKYNVFFLASSLPLKICIELSITNEDKIVHSFNIDELNIKSGPIAPSQTISITIDNLPDESAAYQYYSDIDNDKQNEKLKGILMILK